MSKIALVLYVPALHRGYIELFNKNAEADLFLLDEDVIADYPLAKREIRAISPTTAKDLVSGLGIFKDITLADKKKLAQLSEDRSAKVILSTEQMADDLCQQYFSHHTVIQEDIFLRYDEKTVKSARHEIAYDGQISQKTFDREIIKKALKAAEKSSDWFLRVGAAIISHDPLNERYGHNHWTPTIHSVWMTGDPRNYLEYGSEQSLRTTLHAEQAVIAQAARDGVSTDKASIYVTSFPCPDCCNSIAEAGFSRCYFKDGYSQLSSLDTFTVHGIELIRVL